jgi:hypothetical protein
MRALIATVVLGGVFGSASATVESNDGEVMVVSIEVEVSGTAESVVAHLSFEDEMLTLPLLDRGGGVFGVRTELEPKNYAVVFETLGAGGESSEPTTLAQLGADLGPETAPTTTTTLAEDELSGESRQMLWLAVALGAASLSLIAFWVLGGGRDDEEGDEESAAGGGDSGGEEE